MRSIVEEVCFTACAVKIFGSPQLADAALDPLKWVLAREPDFSQYQVITVTPAGPLYACRTTAHGPFASVAVYFTVDSQGAQVVMHDIQP